MSFYRKSAGVLQDVWNFYRMSVIFYRMFRNGILEYGWMEKDEGVGMEVKSGCEEVQELENGAEE